MANTTKQKFNELAKSIQLKTGETGARSMTGNQFNEKIRSIDRLKPMTATLQSDADNGYLGYEVAACARTYMDTRYLDGMLWNYNDASIFDVDANGNANLRGAPKQYKSDGVTPSGQWTDHVSNGNYRAQNNIIDCSTFVGLVLRGIDYQNSPYYTISASTWKPGNGTTGIRKKAARQNAPAWAQKILDYQPAGTGINIGHDGYTTIRTAADIAELYYKIGTVIYDSKRDGALAAYPAAATGSSMTGFALASTPGENLLTKIRPGDLILFAKSSASESQKSRFRSISHIGIAAENPAYMYEATTLKKTLYYRKLLGTAATPAGIFGEIALILRPDYRPRVAQTDNVPENTELLTFPWTFSRLNTEDKVAAAIAAGSTQADAETASALDGIWVKMLDKNVIGLWGRNSETWYKSLRGSTTSALAYNKLTLTPGTYRLALSVSGSVTKDGAAHTGTGFQLQLKQAGTTKSFYMSDSVVTDAYDDAEIVLDNQDEFTFNEDSIVTGTVGGDSQTAISATQSAPVDFTVRSGTTIDVCVRLYIGPNNGNGYVFGSGSGSSKTYAAVTVSLQRTGDVS